MVVESLGVGVCGCVEGYVVLIGVLFYVLGLVDVLGWVEVFVKCVSYVGVLVVFVGVDG